MSSIDSFAGLIAVSVKGISESARHTHVSCLIKLVIAADRRSCGHHNDKIVDVVICADDRRDTFRSNRHRGCLRLKNLGHRRSVQHEALDRLVFRQTEFVVQPSGLTVTILSPLPKLAGVGRSREKRPVLVGFHA
jgi:hypothetical protein